MGCRSLRLGKPPVVCVGEAGRDSVREAAGTVRHQLSCRLAQIPPGSQLLVAYEPEWAIGATESASPDRIAAVTGAIRMVADEAGFSVRVLYGGSADRGLFSELSRAATPGQCPDGLFLGRAGLDIANLAEIVRELSQARRLSPAEPG